MTGGEAYLADPSAPSVLEIGDKRLDIAAVRADRWLINSLALEDATPAGRRATRSDDPARQAAHHADRQFQQKFLDPAAFLVCSLFVLIWMASKIAVRPIEPKLTSAQNSTISALDQSDPGLSYHRFHSVHH